MRSVLAPVVSALLGLVDPHQPLLLLGLAPVEQPDGGSGEANVLAQLALHVALVVVGEELGVVDKEDKAGRADSGLWCVRPRLVSNSVNNSGFEDASMLVACRFPEDCDAYAAM